jgi:N-succinyldiaminopimelate aminotransferase
MQTTIFTVMTALAERTGAINLGQGFPDTDGPEVIREAAVEALRAGHNQYAPLPGIPALREAIAAHQREHYGLPVEPDGVQVTFGATEAIAAALLAVVEPGDKVLALDPSYDSYAPIVRRAGGTMVPVELDPPDWRLGDLDVPAGATAIVLNTPHNPTGRVLDHDELRRVAAACLEHDLIAITDEVYEHLVYDGKHVPLATLPGMWERTITVSSLGKTHSFTGWKTGWASGPAELIARVRSLKQFMTFAGGTPFQHAAAVGVGLDNAELVASLRGKRDRLAAGLREAGFDVLPCAGTYFLNATLPGELDAEALCMRLPEAAGVVGIPLSAFTAEDRDATRPIVRFAFCKRDDVLDEAVARLRCMRR